MSSTTRLLLLAFLSACSSPCHGQECPAEFKVATSDNLETMLDRVEGQVRALSTSFSQAFNTRCSNLADCQCSQWKCSDNVGTAECSTYGGSTRPAGCASSSSCDAMMANFQESAVYWPGEGNMDSQQKELMCGTKSVDAKFREIEQNLPGLLYAYFGGYNGVYREYPATPWQCGQGYDPRIRPWYRAASSGPKDVVILVDVSGSMTNIAGTNSAKSRLELVQEALGSPDSDRGGKVGLLDAFGHSDYVSVVAFSSEAQVVGGGTTLLRGTKENLRALKTGVSNLKPLANTHFRAGFSRAFQLLRESAESERTSNCKRVIVFLTDGIDSYCGDDAGPTQCARLERDGNFFQDGVCRCREEYLNQVEQWQQGLEATGERANIFTFSMSDAADDALPRQIACRNRGSWARINDGDDPLSAMQVFFGFLAKQLAVSAEKATGAATVYWSEPFEDWSLSERVLSTAVAPVFNSGNLVGVAAIDVPPEVLATQFAGGQELSSLSAQLQARSRTCNGRTSQLAACEFQMMRLGQQTGVVQRQTTCPASFTSPQSCCFLAPDTGKRFRIVEQAAVWDDAAAWCRSNSGRLAEVGDSDDEDLHLLAGMAPPDGAWVGLSKGTGNAWTWGGGGSVAGSDQRIWSRTGEPVLANDAAFISPVGSSGSIKSFNKAARMPFICEFASSVACPTANCTRSNPSAEMVTGDSSTATAATCQATTETFIQSCPGGSSFAGTGVCRAKSTKVWSGDRDQTLCCPDGSQVNDDADDDDDDDGGSGNAAVIGRAVGGVAGALVLAGGGYIAYKAMSKPKPVQIAPRPPVNPNMGAASSAPLWNPEPPPFNPDAPPAYVP